MITLIAGYANSGKSREIVRRAVESSKDKRVLLLNNEETVESLIGRIDSMNPSIIASSITNNIYIVTGEHDPIYGIDIKDTNSIVLKGPYDEIYLDLNIQRLGEIYLILKNISNYIRLANNIFISYIVPSCLEYSDLMVVIEKTLRGFNNDNNSYSIAMNNLGKEFDIDLSKYALSFPNINSKDKK